MENAIVIKEKRGVVEKFKSWYKQKIVDTGYSAASEDVVYKVLDIKKNVEQVIIKVVATILTLDPEKTRAIMNSVETEINKLESLGKSAIIITSPIVRMYFKKLTEDYFKDLIVLSYNEVESNIELQSVGMVTA